jgi:NADH-quinone oxidoreductase subunit J
MTEITDLISQLVFYVFSALSILMALMVIASKNPVRAVLFLVFTFFCVGALWMLLEAEFLSIVLVLVYVGAVMVLFLFVVMMLDIEAAQIKEPLVKYWPIGAFVACTFLGIMALSVGQRYFGLDSFPATPAVPIDYSNVKAVGGLLYTNFLLPFEIAGVILLVAMIAAIGLAYRGRREARTQNISAQVQVRKRDRLSIIKMPSEKGEQA